MFCPPDVTQAHYYKPLESKCLSLDADEMEKEYEMDPLTIGQL